MKLACPCALLLFSLTSTAQHWKSLGPGTVSPGSVSTLSADTVGDRLIASGTFQYIRNEDDTVLGLGIAAWNGQRWDSLAHRIQRFNGNIASQVFWLTRFQGDLYVCGVQAIETAPDVFTTSFGRLNPATQRWEALECTNPGNSGLITLVPRQPGANLYATGFRTSLCGYPESCVYRYDGSAFHEWPPFDEIPIYDNNYVGVVFEFRGMTYMAGTYRDPFSTGFCSLLRHNGTNWEYVPGWGAQSAPIKDIAIRNDTLYVAGAFRQPASPGNGVAAFDGEHWNDLGGGLLLQLAPQYTSVLSLQWFGDELYAGGQFTTAAGIAANGLAKWNGRQWCSLPGFDQPPGPTPQQVVDMAVWRDSLYIVGAFDELEGVPCNTLAQWIGADDVSDCSDPVGIAESWRDYRISVAPNPATDNVTIVSSQGIIRHYRVLDLNGRQVAANMVNAHRFIFERNGLAAGPYFVELDMAGGTVVRKLMLE